MKMLQKAAVADAVESRLLSEALRCRLAEVKPDDPLIGVVPKLLNVHDYGSKCQRR